MSDAFSLRRAIGVLGATTLATQAVNAGLIPIQAHFYEPVSVGILANALSVAMILSPLSTMQFVYALPQQREPTFAAGIAAVALLSLCGALGLLGFVGGICLVAARASPTTVEIALYGLCLVPCLALYDLGRLTAARDGAFRAVGAQNLLLAALRGAVQIVGGLSGGGQLWLLAAETLSRLGSFGAVGRSIAHLWNTARISRLDLAAAVRKNWRFPAIYLPSSMLNSLGGYLPAILIGNLYGMRSAGLLFLAQRIVWFPVTLLSQAAGDAIHVRAAQLLHADRQDFSRFVLKAIAGFFLVGIACALFLLVLIIFLWPFFFGSNWADARSMALALLLPCVFQTVCGATSRILLVAHRQSFKLYFDFLYLLGSLSPLILQKTGHIRTVEGAVWGMAAGHALAYVVYFGAIVAAALRPVDLEASGP